MRWGQMKHLPNEKVILLLNNIIKTECQEIKELSDTTNNISKNMFREYEIPTDNICKHQTNDKNTLQIVSQTDIRLLAAKKLLGANICTNAIAYVPMSYMAWHTNSDVIGERIYYTYTEGESIFRYRDADGTIKEDLDNIGWTTRSFKITDELFWHTVWTEKLRYAFGFNKHA
jgi:hypothetical protein